MAEDLSPLSRLLRDYSQAHGAPGNEAAVRAIFLRETGALGGTLSADKLGGVQCALAGEKGGPRVMLTAHMDEVGFMVQHISAEGFLQFVPLGGWSENTLLSQRVRVLTRSGRELLGVIASVPKHFLPAGAVAPGIDKMSIDIGATCKAQAEEEFGVRLGDAIVPESPFVTLANSRMVMAKAFDNRAGMAVLTRSLQQLAKEKLPNQILGVATVQEEVGVRGAETAVTLARPDVALVLEGPPADDSPGFNRTEAQGKLGGGVQIRVYDPTAIMNRSLVELVRAVAEGENIPHQVTVRRSGGTDARAIQLFAAGVPVVVLGVPARYIHSHNAILCLDDLEACLRLTVALARRFDEKTVAGLTSFL